MARDEYRGGGRQRSEETRTVELAGRVPPQDVGAEKAVLSSILLDNDAIHNVYTEVKPEDFYHPAHQILYRAMVSLKDANEPVDLTTLADHLTTSKQLDAVGGPVALAELVDYESTAANVLHHARIVADKATKRSLIHVATEIAELGYDQVGDADELLDSAESKIFALSQDKAKSTLSRLDEELHGAVDFVEHLMAQGGELTGVATGFKDFDEMTGGLQPGDLIILAARPSMGKTALALNVARNAAVDHGKKVAVFSLEMTTRSLVLRLLAAEAQFDMTSFRRGFVPSTAYAKITAAANDLSGADIMIDDSSSATILEIRAKCRRMHAQHGLDLVVVDYLQLARGDTRVDSREQEISEISRGLKGLAKELQVPVMALSQLNRGPESRKAEDKRPILADLRESGAIEQDADLIGFIYRDIVYNPDTEDENCAELIIRKQRNGPVGTVKLTFEGQFARFSDYSPRENPYAGAPPGASSPGAGGSPFGGPAFGQDDDF
ncbi:MAG: replicative DNA helicase [Proteobacteria bacterium]|nr:replicative DNA helicase [Pseudomonadota bacterium]